MKIKEFTNGAYVTFEKSNGWYCVLLRNPMGNVHDKIRCDSYADAMNYWKCFQKIAKTL